jgi:parvulin-like peptidyl-prolyl isomerase
MAAMFRSLVVGRVAVGLAVFSVLSLPSRDARAEEPRARVARAPVPLDGVAAIVDDVVIFRSDIAQRAKHFDQQLSKNPVERRAELVALQKQLLSRAIDEILIAKEAAKLHIVASDEDVAAALGSVAAANKMDRSKLEAEVVKQGFTLVEYREELRRQIVEQRWLVSQAGAKIDRKLANDAAALQAAFDKQRDVLLVDLRSRTFIEIK